MCLSDAGEAMSWEKEKNAPPSVAQAFLPLIFVVGADGFCVPPGPTTSKTARGFFVTKELIFGFDVAYMPFLPIFPSFECGWMDTSLISSPQYRKPWISEGVRYLYSSSIIDFSDIGSFFPKECKENRGLGSSTPKKSHFFSKFS